MPNTTRYVAFHKSRKRLPIVAVDIGYSSNARSCGIAWTGHKQPICLHFGKAIEKVAELCEKFEQPLLVIEAALSTFHRENGNPDIRGEFEKGRGWYWGPGAVSMIAASRFLLKLAELLPSNSRVLLGEAFLSNKPERTKHQADAAQIVAEFWQCPPQPLERGAEPLTHLISGVPSVRVFGTGAVHANNTLVPTRKGEAPLRAAQRGRWALKEKHHERKAK